MREPGTCRTVVPALDPASDPVERTGAGLKQEWDLGKRDTWGLMALLNELVEALADGRIEVIDLTAPLSSGTPIIQLPPPFANTRRFELTEISHYDERGPAWYWNDFSTGEHVGTHFDAPIHWATGREGQDVSEVPVRRL